MQWQLFKSNSLNACAERPTEVVQNSLLVLDNLVPLASAELAFPRKLVSGFDNVLDSDHHSPLVSSTGGSAQDARLEHLSSGNQRTREGDVAAGTERRSWLPRA